MVSQVDAQLQREAERQAAIGRIFGNSKRVLILWALTDRELSVSEIAETVGTSLQNTSQHLRLMRERDILRSRREGQTIFYSVAEDKLFRFCKQILLHKEGKETEKFSDSEPITKRSEYHGNG